MVWRELKVISLFIKLRWKFAYHFRLYLYWTKLPRKIEIIRQKPTITVLFVVTELGSWKSLALFQSMFKHPRFRPLIGVNRNPKYPNEKLTLTNYLENHGFSFFDLDDTLGGIDSIGPDIIIYDSPYTSAYPNGLSFDKNLQYVFCGNDYCLNITKHKVHLDHPWYDYCWQFYVEHEDVAKRKRELLGYRARNIRVTGVPIQDVLLLPKEKFSDPWKDKTGKKRIIYAPHHSFKGSNGDGIEFATFMEFGVLMLNIARKYREEVTFAFKPHPFLYIKLLSIWGEKRTQAYYKEWNNMPNAQYENGDYYGLFKYSDAIIHDSASFIIEYLYMNNPSMFLVAETNKKEDMFDFVIDGFNCHEHGRSDKDIEQFIQNVIAGIDKKSNQRKMFIDTQLQPPNGKTACDNIINTILNG